MISGLKYSRWYENPWLQKLHRTVLLSAVQSQRFLNGNFVFTGPSNILSSASITFAKLLCICTLKYGVKWNHTVQLLCICLCYIPFLLMNQSCGQHTIHFNCNVFVHTQQIHFTIESSVQLTYLATLAKVKNKVYPLQKFDAFSLGPCYTIPTSFKKFRPIVFQ